MLKGSNATVRTTTAMTTAQPLLGGKAGSLQAAAGGGSGSAEASVEVSEAMLPGHASLPNGYGLDFVDGDGKTRVPGGAPNALTTTRWRDAYAGTPGHKHGPARIEAVGAA